MNWVSIGIFILFNKFEVLKLSFHIDKTKILNRGNTTSNYVQDRENTCENKMKNNQEPMGYNSHLRNIVNSVQSYLQNVYPF